MHYSLGTVNEMHAAVFDVGVIERAPAGKHVVVVLVAARGDTAVRFGG